MEVFVSRVPPRLPGRKATEGEVHIIFGKENNNMWFHKKNQIPPKINIEPENDGLEDYFPLPGVYSQVPC